MRNASSSPLGGYGVFFDLLFFLLFVSSSCNKNLLEVIRGLPMEDWPFRPFRPFINSGPRDSRDPVCGGPTDSRHVRWNINGSLDRGLSVSGLCSRRYQTPRVCVPKEKGERDKCQSVKVSHQAKLRCRNMIFVGVEPCFPSVSCII